MENIPFLAFYRAKRGPKQKTLSQSLTTLLSCGNFAVIEIVQRMMSGGSDPQQKLIRMKNHDYNDVLVFYFEVFMAKLYFQQVIMSVLKGNERESELFRFFAGSSLRILLKCNFKFFSHANKNS